MPKSKIEKMEDELTDFMQKACPAEELIAIMHQYLADRRLGYVTTNAVYGALDGVHGEVLYQAWQTYRIRREKGYYSRWPETTTKKP